MNMIRTDSDPFHFSRHDQPSWSNALLHEDTQKPERKEFRGYQQDAVTGRAPARPRKLLKLTLPLSKNVDTPGSSDGISLN
jgi:hypothetical protein